VAHNPLHQFRVRDELRLQIAKLFQHQRPPRAGTVHHPPSHHPGIAKFQPRRVQPTVSEEGQRDSLDAVAREATVLAHPFDFQQPPVEVAPKRWR